LFASGWRLHYPFAQYFIYKSAQYSFVLTKFERIHKNGGGNGTCAAAAAGIPHFWSQFYVRKQDRQRDKGQMKCRFWEGLINYFIAHIFWCNFADIGTKMPEYRQ
jgi:hypothetical protein